MGLFETASVALLGLVFAVFVLIALAAAFVDRLRAHWARIAVRVAGSCIAASGLLMLGWAVRTLESVSSPPQRKDRIRSLTCSSTLIQRYV
jgi:protein-S-isoprenylcysteine O-methyltransferase Ste14